MGERWVEVWKGDRPEIAGRKLEAEGIEMKIAASNWGAHGGALGIIGLFRKTGQAKLLVREEDRERAKQALERPGL
jgi:hypothetical protein